MLASPYFAPQIHHLSRPTRLGTPKILSTAAPKIQAPFALRSKATDLARQSFKILWFAPKILQGFKILALQDLFLIKAPNPRVAFARSCRFHTLSQGGPLGSNIFISSVSSGAIGARSLKFLSYARSNQTSATTHKACAQ